jgi:hypothetical protein
MMSVILALCITFISFASFSRSLWCFDISLKSRHRRRAFALTGFRQIFARFRSPWSFGSSFRQFSAKPDLDPPNTQHNFGFEITFLGILLFLCLAVQLSLVALV